MPPSRIPEATDDSTLTCIHKGGFHHACDKEPFYQEHEGKRYCALHFPGEEKGIAFKEALRRKLDSKDFDFHAVWFPDYISFTNYHFDTKADFSRATFNDAADFLETQFLAGADFRDATFKARVDFGAAIFGRPDEKPIFAVARFSDATFNAEASFRYVRFKYVYFTSATFNGEADFSDAVFEAEADFSNATFADYVRFARDTRDEETLNNQSSLSFQHARFDKPTRLSFHTLTLRPYWFVNIDARQFNFINVRWDWNPIINEEIEALKSKGVLEPQRLLSIACRQLAVNAEENHRYDEASKFRYWSMYARQQETWSGLTSWWKFRSWLSIQWSRIVKLPILRFFNRNWLYWLYWAASGYGERVFRAFAVMIGVWVFFALLYTQVGFARWEPRRSNVKEAMTEQRDEVGEPLKLPRALAYSLAVMILQKPEPRPATTAAQSFVMLETILGPLQAALLALAIRRKFMR